MNFTTIHSSFVSIWLDLWTSTFGENSGFSVAPTKRNSNTFRRGVNENRRVCCPLCAFPGDGFPPVPCRPGPTAQRPNGPGCSCRCAWPGDSSRRCAGLARERRGTSRAGGGPLSRKLDGGFLRASPQGMTRSPGGNESEGDSNKGNHRG